MEPNTVYVPILKAKFGEFQALRELQPAKKRSITPMIVIQPVDLNPDTGLPTKTVDAHVQLIPQRILEAWGPDQSIFVDFANDPDDRMLDGSHPLTYVFDESRALGLKLIPVTGISRESDYQEAVGRVASIDGRGVCFRLETEDLEDDEELADELDSLCSELELSPGQVDILIDLGPIAEDQMPIIQSFLRNLLRFFPKINDWRSLILSATSIPETLSGIGTYTAKNMPRLEWIIWKNLIGSGKLKRTPNFSDYTTVHPTHMDLDFRVIQIGGKVKYTLEEEWLIVKGQSFKRRGGEQNRDLCAYITANPEYRSRDYSWGDNCIYECAQGTGGTGNPTTWVKAGVNQHICFVADQIASFFSS
jgi:hypothetical protein